jgi:hypothetical protein
MSQETIIGSNDVIKNLQIGKGFSNSEAYAYAFGWAWVMLSETDRLRFIQKTEEMLKEKN